MPDQITDPEGGQSNDWSPPDELAGNQPGNFDENISQGSGPSGPEVQIMREPIQGPNPAGAGVDPYGAMLPELSDTNTSSSTTPAATGDIGMRSGMGPDATATPTFQGNGYNFIAPGVAFGTMTPGGERLGQPGYSWYNKATRGWVQVPSEMGGMKPQSRMPTPSVQSRQPQPRPTTLKSFSELQ